MPWPVRSTRFMFYNGTPAANTPTSSVTVPTGKKWLVKEWRVYNAGASTRDVFMLMTVSGTTNVWDKATVASAAVNGAKECALVLNAGESLSFQTTVAQAIQIEISGAQLG